MPNSISTTLQFKQDGVGAVARSYANKCKERITPLDFGAVGDGNIDDYDAIVAALEYIETLEDDQSDDGHKYTTKPVLDFAGKTYAISDSIVVSGNKYKGIKITNGTLTPSGGFDPRKHLMKCTNGGAIVDINFECKYISAGLWLAGWEARFLGSVYRFKNFGLRMSGPNNQASGGNIAGLVPEDKITIDGHEVSVLNPTTMAAAQAAEDTCIIVDHGDCSLVDLIAHHSGLVLDVKAGNTTFVYNCNMYNGNQNALDPHNGPFINSKLIRCRNTSDPLYDDDGNFLGYNNEQQVGARFFDCYFQNGEMDFYAPNIQFNGINFHWNQDRCTNDYVVKFYASAVDKQIQGLKSTDWKIWSDNPDIGSYDINQMMKFVPYTGYKNGVLTECTWRGDFYNLFDQYGDHWLTNDLFISKTKVDDKPVLTLYSPGKGSNGAKLAFSNSDADADHDLPTIESEGNLLLLNKHRFRLGSELQEDVVIDMINRTGTLSLVNSASSKRTITLPNNAVPGSFTIFCVTSPLGCNIQPGSNATISGESIPRAFQQYNIITVICVANIDGSSAEYVLSVAPGLEFSRFLGTSTSDKLKTSIEEGGTGTNKLVLNTSPTLNSPTLISPVLGTPVSGDLSNCTGFPSGGITAQAVGDLIDSCTSKASPYNADCVGLMDSNSGNILKKFSWNNLKATFVGTNHNWTKSQTHVPVALVEAGGNLPVNASLSNVFTFTFTTGSTMLLEDPTSLSAGQTIVFQFTQPASGTPATLAFGPSYKFVGSAPSITATLGAKDTLICTARSPSLMDCVALFNISA